MQRYPEYTRERLNLLAKTLESKVYSQRSPMDELLVSPKTDRISYDEAQQLTGFVPAQFGQMFGPLWATFWFRGRARIPQSWDGQRVDLIWNSHSEATLWINGKSMQGFNEDSTGWHSHRRDSAIITKQATGNQAFSFQIEMACNKIFGMVDDHIPNYTLIKPYVLEQCELVLFDGQAWDLYFDYMVLQQLLASTLQQTDKPLNGLLLSRLNEFANTYNPDDRATWAPAGAILKKLYENKNGTYGHEISAIGHAHIDTAWLWPLAETYRKCVRTFSTAVSYMDEYPEYKFACSQAQQYAWIKERNPDLYQRIKAKVKTGQFVPVGGTWIEPDCNIPSGESLIRQFLYGQKFFQQEFGVTCHEFWNPDVFGYNGQLPQIMREVGIKRFLTQKLFWNRFNPPTMHSFIWEGIDGSQVLTHFPPSATYNATVSIEQLRSSAENYLDHDRSHRSYLLFGYGDGGGGPTKPMLETLRRVGNLQGVPRTEIRNSNEFFSQLEQDIQDPLKRIGELYFERHRGTYTSEAAVKRGNRKNEILLHDLEFLATMLTVTAGAEYPAAEIDKLWQLLLLNQFHDILPGSSITEVYQDSARDHAIIASGGTQLCDTALKALGNQNKGLSPINTTGFARAEVAEDSQGRFVYIEAPSYGIGRATTADDKVAVEHSGDTIILENRHLRAVLSTGGEVISLINKATKREALSAPGNQLLLYVDTPIIEDAWDVDPFHLEQESKCPPAESCTVSRKDPLRVEITFERKIGDKSHARQIVSLSANSPRLDFHTVVDWQESHRMLKVAFPVNVRAMNATYDMQFGSTERPTHFNTSYDLARYEVPGHKWSDLSESDFGVALLSESKYGYSTFGNTMRLSLLRSTKYPDTAADMGRQEFAYAIMPHAGTWAQADVVAEAHRFNMPVRWLPGVCEPMSFASVNDGNLVLDTIKRAESGNGIILRLYECHGSRGTATLTCAMPFKSATRCGALEQEKESLPVNHDKISISYEPFKIITIKLQ